MRKSKALAKLPLKLFVESFKYAPRAAVNLLVAREDGAILLTQRKKPPFAGKWHLPGSFLLKGEALMDCARRVAKEELGMDVTDFQLAGAFDDVNGDPRGHVVDLVYCCHLATTQPLARGWVQALKPVGDTAQMKFFMKLPKNIGFNHRDTLLKLGYK